MLVPVYNLAGEEVKQIEVSDLVFAVPFNEAVERIKYEGKQ